MNAIDTIGDLIDNVDLMGNISIEPVWDTLENESPTWKFEDGSQMRYLAQSKMFLVMDNEDNFSYYEWSELKTWGEEDLPTEVDVPSNLQ
tara:strand:- start:7763 stop:8032 length:270 start_codon:yes stop_codon:yes gene_type:complete